MNQNQRNFVYLHTSIRANVWKLTAVKTLVRNFATRAAIGRERRRLPTKHLPKSSLSNPDTCSNYHHFSLTVR